MRSKGDKLDYEKFSKMVHDNPFLSDRDMAPIFGVTHGRLAQVRSELGLPLLIRRAKLEGISKKRQLEIWRQCLNLT